MFRIRRKKRPRAYVISDGAGAALSPCEDASDILRRPVASGAARRALQARNRISMVAVVFAAAFVALGARLALVSAGVATPSRAAAPVAAAHIDQRPEILDRNGSILATNVPVVALEVAGREVWSADETAATLAATFPEIDAADLAGKLRKGRYVEVLSDLTPSEQEAAFALGLPGVRFSQRLRRFYPQEDLAAHVVGHAEAGRGGVMGLERALDARRESGPLVASIDLRVQQALEDELTKGLEEHQAIAAWGGVIDVATGEVLALASLPEFDPNAPGAAPEDSRRNRATYDRYELGSAFKAFTAAAALEAGTATEASSYDARGVFRIADRVIGDFRGKNRVLSFAEVIEFSSNIGMAQMVADLGVEKQKAALKALGLLDPLDIELAENRAPEPPSKWGPVESATVAYGHGISVTPLHLLAAYAAVINGGEFRMPTFLKADGPRQGARVFSEETSLVMRRVLRQVILGGTARFAEVEGYHPVGKTATADKPRRGGYDTTTRIASFVGAFPGYAPRYAVLVSYDEPKPTPGSAGYATAGWNAAPTFAAVVARIAPMLGVMPAGEGTALAAFVAPSALESADSAAIGGAP